MISAGHRLPGSIGLLLRCAAVCAMPASAALGAEALPAGAASCSACHAASDAGHADDPPPLSGLSPDEIAAALAAYRSGDRKGTIMPRLAKGFSDKEARAIAAAVGRGGSASR